MTTQEQLKKIHDLAVVGEVICCKHKCSDVKMFFRLIKELSEYKLKGA